MSNSLKETFLNLSSNYSADHNLSTKLWNEIEKNYSGEKRNYHNLEHLDNLYIQLLEVKDRIQHWEAVLFTLFYHDIVYNAAKSNNEEKSAELAEKRMKQLLVNPETIEICKAQIIATKAHNYSTDRDTNYFTDADLSILGQPWEAYQIYGNNVRKEYSLYPDFIYKPGRKKVLTHFLNMESIFKTDYFYHKFEWQAKQNLQKELDALKHI